MNARGLSRWLPRAAVFAAVAAVTLWVHLYEFRTENTWDAALYLTMAKLLSRGLVLYRDLWETKPPGIFAYFGAVFTVLPVEVWSVRLADYLLYVASGCAFYGMARGDVGGPLALAGTATWLFLMHHPTFNNQGFYSEEYASIAAVGAVAAALRYARGGRLAWALAAGVGVTVAALFKHPGATCGLAVAVLVSGRRPIAALSLVALGAAASLAGTLAWFVWHGTIADFVDCNVTAPLHYTGLARATGASLAARLPVTADRLWTQFAPYPGLLAAVALGGLVAVGRPSRVRLAALAWLIGDLLFVAAQHRYFEHHFIMLFSSAIWLGTLGVGWLVRPRPDRSRWGNRARLAAAAALVALAAPRVLQLVADRQPGVLSGWRTLLAGPAEWPRRPGGAFEVEMADYVTARTAPGDRVFLWSAETAVAMYWSTDRLPASRYLWPALHWSLSPEIVRTATAELEANRPRYVVTTGSRTDNPIAARLPGRYALEAERYGPYRVEFWRRDDSPPDGGS